MAASITKLQDRAAAVAAMLDDLAKVEDRTEAQAAEVEKLSAEAVELEQRLAQETAIAEKIASLRSKVAATAKPVAVETPEAPVASRRNGVPGVGWPSSALQPNSRNSGVRLEGLRRKPSRSSSRSWWRRGCASSASAGGSAPG